MKLYNTLSHEKELFRSLEPGHVRLYSCGPTVYRFIHIGNLRTFTMSDWLRRALLREGYKVTHVKNITDVGHMRVERLDQGEDKLIAQARKEGKSSYDIAAFYTEAFMSDERKLNILPATIFPRATQHIPEMVEIVRGLVAKGIAYEVEGNIFFDIHNYPAYGKLSGNQLEGLLEGAKDVTDRLRRHPEDFPLWKQAEPGREMAWESPWGLGFPGWHIECSAMSMKYLGEHFDIHTGGVDNIFPHHECELAQSEAYTGESFVNIWVHAQHLLADGLKMSKSTGNSYTLADIEARGFEPLALRYFFTTAHYRSRINFTFTALRAAETSLRRLRARAATLAAQVGLEPVYIPDGHAGLWTAKFWTAINDDLNVPQAMAVLWQMLKQPAESVSPAAKLSLLFEWDEFLGLGLREYLQSYQPVSSEAALANWPAEIAQAVREREICRLARDWKTADIIRAALSEKGYTLRDTKEGPQVLARRLEDEIQPISSSSAVANNLNKPPLYDFSVSLIAHNSREDSERCIQSLLRHRAGRKIELLIIDNGSTDDTLPYLLNLAKKGLPDEPEVTLQVIFADHNLGFAAGRNATTRLAQGRYVVWLDTSIELNGDIWQDLETALAQPQIGLVGPYGLVTSDLRDFYESSGPNVDAIEGYLMAFRRENWLEVGPVDEKFRFYRLMDIHLSFYFLTGSYEVVVLPEVAAKLLKHPHREWYSLSEEEQRTKSKKNYDLFRTRWHHGQTLLVTNGRVGAGWLSHDDARHLGDHSHAPEELPPPGVPHVHNHQHWADHAHAHPHYHAKS